MVTTWKVGAAGAAFGVRQVAHDAGEVGQQGREAVGGRAVDQRVARSLVLGSLRALGGRHEVARRLDRPGSRYDVTPLGANFHVASGLDEAAVTQVQAAARTRILRAFVAGGGSHQHPDRAARVIVDWRLSLGMSERTK